MGRRGDALDFGWMEVVSVHFDNDVAGLNVYSLFVNAMASSPNLLEQGR